MTLAAPAAPPVATPPPAVGGIARLSAPPPDDPDVLGNWDRPPWRAVPELVLAHHMGAPPRHRPRTAAKLGWDDQALYVLFRVEDAYVRAVARRHQDSVCRDSCVEFFFAPGADVAQGYFNLEINCGGTVLFHFQTMPRQNNIQLPPRALKQLTIRRTLPARVDPEIREPVTWLVECRVPFEVLAPYGAWTRPEPGTRWRGNLYKCADATSEPHWLTWSPMVWPRPNFHLPEQFGVLTFE